MHLHFVILNLFAVFNGASTMLGVDVSAKVSTSALQCIQQSPAGSYGDIFVARIYRSNGQTDPIGLANLETAANVEFGTLDGYIYPTMRQDAADQVNAALDALEAGGFTSLATLWLDIEEDTPAGYGTHWQNDQKNIQFIIELLEAAYSKSSEWADQGYTKFQVGIYASKRGWQSITGNTATIYEKFVEDQGKQLLLWYAHWDGRQSFEDFLPFGGWTTPQRKQFKGDFTLCGTDVDLNYEQ